MYCALFAFGATSQEAMVLDDNQNRIDLWPRVTVLSESGAPLSATEAQSETARFQAPGKDAALGINAYAVWLRIPLQTSPSSEGKWIFEIEYPPLQKVDVALFEGERLLSVQELGSLRPLSNRPLASRTHAVPLTLKPASAYQLFVRIETKGSMILPIALKKVHTFHQDAINEQFLQGFLLSIALCLVVYSLFRGATLRDFFFLKYAILVAGGAATSLLQMGIGAQHLWSELPWIELHIAGLGSLAALAGTFLFLEEALREPVIGTPSRWRYSRIMQGGAVLLAIIAIAFALDLFGLRILALMLSILGTLPTLISIPRLLRRVRRHDVIGWYLLLAFTVYMVGAMTLTAVVRGQIPANFWTLHSFQFAATFDMLIFLFVLTFSTRGSQLAAYRAEQQQAAMQSLASTDPLTGLTNRRGLNEKLASTLAHTSTKNLAVIYMIDVDGFKPINDNFGHDLGDQLLIAISQRLRSHVRDKDLVARVGGDEFIIVVNEMHNEQQAEELGAKLLGAFDAPFFLDSHTINIGLTIGYTIIPVDATEASAAIKLADNAMYAGKHSGRRCLRRAVSLPATDNSLLSLHPTG
jgi:diguanylate cyclase (GGDEF)-like protein